MQVQVLAPIDLEEVPEMKLQREAPEGSDSEIESGVTATVTARAVALVKATATATVTARAVALVTVTATLTVIADSDQS